MIIYQAINLINGKSYIGKTKTSLEKRKWGHLNNAKKGVKSAFYNAIRKYGEENFKFIVIDELKLHRASVLNDKEKYYISLFNTIAPNGYNMTKGGDGNDGSIKPNLGKHLSEEAKERLRIANLGKNHSEETKIKMSDSLKKFYGAGGKNWNNGLTKETHPSILSQSEKIKGNIPWNKGMEGFLKGKISWNKGLTKKDHPSIARQAEKVSNVIPWNKGLTKEIDSRVKKYSESIINSSNTKVWKKGHKPWNKGLHVVHSEESNKRRSETMRGRKKSLATIENMRAAQRKRREEQKMLIAV